MAFTLNYSQPEDYHFSLDSIELAKRFCHRIEGRSDLKKLKFLDLCAGCGVVGLEVVFHLPQIGNFDFVEIQSEYQSHFEFNKKKFPNKNFQFNLVNFVELAGESWKDRYDFIVSNPPYFEIGQGKLSPSEFKNRCRFFFDGTIIQLYKSVLNCLKSDGEAYLLLRDLKDHKRDQRKKIESELAGKAKIEYLDPVRGTGLIMVKKI